MFNLHNKANNLDTLHIAAERERKQKHTHKHSCKALVNKIQLYKRKVTVIIALEH